MQALLLFSLIIPGHAVVKAIKCFLQPTNPHRHSWAPGALFTPRICYIRNLELMLILKFRLSHRKYSFPRQCSTTFWKPPMHPTMSPELVIKRHGTKESRRDKTSVSSWILKLHTEFTQKTSAEERQGRIDHFNHM